MSFRTIVYFILFSALAAGIYTFETFSEPRKKQRMIAFYNVENLFDTLDNPHTNDHEFLPSSFLHWNTEKYSTKKKHLAEVIHALEEKDLALLGLAEVENAQVVEDVLKMPELKKRYHYIHEESSDPRGIDVALVYSEDVFRPLFHKLLPPCNAQHECLESRSVLVVKGILENDTVWVYVNHWPSRRSGVSESEKKRILVSDVVKRSVDSVWNHNAQNKIIVMGDFNDTPADRSIVQLCKDHILFNPFQNLVGKEGSLKYKKDWLIYDQILLSTNWIAANKKSIQYIDKTAEIYHPLFLHYKEKEENGPYRTFRGKQYYGGYSDHFPVYFFYTY